MSCWGVWGAKPHKRVWAAAQEQAKSTKKAKSTKSIKTNKQINLIKKVTQGYTKVTQEIPKKHQSYISYTGYAIFPNQPETNTIYIYKRFGDKKCVIE